MLEFFDCQRIALVIESASDVEAVPHHGGVLGPQSGQALFQTLVGGYQIGLPVETLEHDTLYAAAQKCRRSLRGGHAAPYHHFGALLLMARHFPQSRVKNAGGFVADKACGFGPFESNGAGRLRQLKDKGEERQIPADRNTREPA